MRVRQAIQAQYARSMQPDWTAPAAAGPVRARLRPPGSKSITNRALVLAALASGPTVITNPLRARDTLLMAAALRSLGSVIADTSPPAGPGESAAWQVTPGCLSGLQGSGTRPVPGRLVSQRPGVSQAVRGESPA